MLFEAPTWKVSHCLVRTLPPRTSFGVGCCMLYHFPPCWTKNRFSKFKLKGPLGSASCLKTLMALHAGCSCPCRNCVHRGCMDVWWDGCNIPAHSFYLQIVRDSCRKVWRSVVSQKHAKWVTTTWEWPPSGWELKSIARNTTDDLNNMKVERMSIIIWVRLDCWVKRRVTELGCWRQHRISSLV